MAEPNQKKINIVLGAGVLILVVLLIALYVNLNGQLEQDRASLTKQTQELRDSFKQFEEQNIKLLSYLDEYHGGDDKRGEEFAKMKILIEDHGAKINKILQTINELH